MAKGLVIHRSDEGQRENIEYSRRVSFDGVEFGMVCRHGWPDEIKWWSFMPYDEFGNEDDLPRKLRGIKCKKEYDRLWQLRTELESLIQGKSRVKKS